MFTLYKHWLNSKYNVSTHSGDNCTTRRHWVVCAHDDVIKWEQFPRYWPFVRGIHRSLVNSPHKGQLRGALMFSLSCAWTNGWVSNLMTVIWDAIMTSLECHFLLEIYLHNMRAMKVHVPFSSNESVVFLFNIVNIYQYILRLLLPLWKQTLWFIRIFINYKTVTGSSSTSKFQIIAPRDHHFSLCIYTDEYIHYIYLAQKAYIHGLGYLLDFYGESTFHTIYSNKICSYKSIEKDIYVSFPQAFQIRMHRPRCVLLSSFRPQCTLWYL